MLPPPVGASNELRDALAATPTPDIEAAKAKVPKTIEEWKASIAEQAKGAEVVTKALAEQRSVKIEEDRGRRDRWSARLPPHTADHRAGACQPSVRLHPRRAFVKGGGLGSSLEGIGIAAHMGIPVISVDYRMAPEHPAPAAMDDIVAVWQEVIKDRAANTVAFGGTSAGANLTLVSTLRMKDLGIDLPGALFVGTPPAFLDKKGDMRFINEGVDRYLVTWDAEPAAAVAMYVGNKSYEDPYLSPFYGDFEGFPPAYQITGTRDLMLSDTALIHRKLRRAGVEADLHVYEGRSHGDYVLQFNAPEATEHLNELNAFLLRHLK
jgi:acetyl esterase/lipase